MDIQLLPDDLADFLPDSPPRSQGLHVKAIIDDLALIQGFLKHDVQLTTTWAQFGLIWERAVVSCRQERAPGRYVRIGEIERDRIYGTPDLLDTEDWAVEEYKLKWMSSAHDIRDCTACRKKSEIQRPTICEKLWRDLMQVMAYCYMIDSGIGRLLAGFVNGDWKKDGIGPSISPWECRFKSQELSEVWRMIKRHGEDNRERLEERAA